MQPRPYARALSLVLLLTACSEDPVGRPDACALCTDASDAATTDDADAHATDVTLPTDAQDAARTDAMDAAGDRALDAPTTDARDASGPDASALDASMDVLRDGGASDATTDAPRDVPADTARADVATDVPRDASAGGCVSGATGNYALRFRWAGSGSGSTAYVQYEANNLPDASRWHVSAASRSIGYTPVYDDTFLGPGGLDLSGTVFIDVQLSTAGLSSIANVTLAIYGRSFNTTASGSFSWQTFTGVGAAPTNLVANSAPYEWYGADATSEFVPGDNGVLLRIYPGPSSSALIVNRVEVCFDAR